MASEKKAAAPRDKATRDKVKAQFDELSAEVDKLKAQAEKVSAEQRMKYYEYVETLDKKRERLKKRVEDLKDAGGAAIDEIESGMKEAWQRIAIAKKAAEARFKSEANQ